MLIKGSEIRKLIREELTRSMLREGVDNNIYDTLVQKLKNSIDKKNYWEDIDTLLATFLDSVPEELKNTISGSSVESIKTGWSTEASKIKSIGGASVSFSNDAAGLLKFVKSIKRMMDVMDVKAFQAYIKMSDAQQTGKWDDATDAALKAYLEKMKNSKKDIDLAGSSFDDILKNGWKSESGKITSLGGKAVKYTDNLEGLMSFVKDVEAVGRPMFSGTDYKYGEEVRPKLTSESTIRRIVRETLTRAMMREGDPPEVIQRGATRPRPRRGEDTAQGVSVALASDLAYKEGMKPIENIKIIQNLLGIAETGWWNPDLERAFDDFLDDMDASGVAISGTSYDDLVKPSGWATSGPKITAINGIPVKKRFTPDLTGLIDFIRALESAKTIKGAPSDSMTGSGASYEGD